MAYYRIPRMGKPVLAFDGEVIAEACTDRTDKAHRWHELVCYRTRGGKLVCDVRHFTKWEGEDNTRRAEAFDSAAELAAWLAAYNPRDDFRGPPPNPMKTAQRQYALHDLQVRWEITIGELLAQIPEANEAIE